MSFSRPPTITLEGLLAGYTVTHSATSSTTKDLLNSSLPSIIASLISGTKPSAITQVAELSKHSDYSIKLSAGTLCHLEKGDINAFVEALNEAIHDEAFMCEKSKLSGYHKGF